MNKAEIRKMVKEKLEHVPADLYHRWSREIAAILFSIDEWKNAATIAITISRGREVETRAIIQEGWKQGKRIVVPKCEPISRDMTFRVLDSFDQLEVVYYGLEEPMEAETEAVSASEINLMLVPGLAYNQKGYRVGFGGGFYDRFLSKYKGKTASLAFEVQLVEDLPIEDHDIAVDKIITNERVILCQ